MTREYCTHKSGVYLIEIAPSIIDSNEVVITEQREWSIEDAEESREFNKLQDRRRRDGEKIEYVIAVVDSADELRELEQSIRDRKRARPIPANHPERSR